MPARKEEVEHAEEEGIIFKTLCNPVEVLGDEKGFVKGVKCIEMELGEPDASGRRRPIEKPGSEFVLDVDCMIMSIGTSPNPLIKSTTKGLDTNKHGCIVADETTGPDFSSRCVRRRRCGHRRGDRYPGYGCGQERGQGDRRIYSESVKSG